MGMDISNARITGLKPSLGQGYVCVCVCVCACCVKGSFGKSCQAVRCFKINGIRTRDLLCESEDHHHHRSTDDSTWMKHHRRFKIRQFLRKSKLRTFSRGINYFPAHSYTVYIQKMFRTHFSDNSELIFHIVYQFFCQRWGSANLRFVKMMEQRAPIHDLDPGITRS
jgi:hypothetical protein